MTIFWIDQCHLIHVCLCIRGKALQVIYSLSTLNNPHPPCCFAQRASTQENQEEKCKLGVMGANHVAVPVRCGCLCGLYTLVYFLQFVPVVGNFAAEKQTNLDILEKLGKKKSVLDVKKATNALIAAGEESCCGMLGFKNNPPLINLPFHIWI